MLLQTALLHPNGGALTVEMLNPLSRAVPETKEANDIRLFLKVQLQQVDAIMRCTAFDLPLSDH